LFKSILFKPGEFDALWKALGQKLRWMFIRQFGGTLTAYIEVQHLDAWSVVNYEFLAVNVPVMNVNQ
jgi:hypothetical protein